MDIRIASRDQTNVTRCVTGLKPEKVKVDRFFAAAPNPLNCQYIIHFTLHVLSLYFSDKTVDSSFSFLFGTLATP